MRIYYQNLRNLAHALSLSIFVAFKGFNFYIFLICSRVGFCRAFKISQIHWLKHNYTLEPYLGARA